MANQDRDASLHGVGGWMYLFLFGFGFVAPIQMFFGTAANLYGDPAVAKLLGDRWLSYQVATWAIIALGLMVVATVVWRLYNVQNPKTVWITIFAIPGIGIGLPLLDWLASVAIIGVDAGLMFREIAPDFARPAIYSAIWCSYFKLSKRVYNTYLAPQEDETIEVFE